MIILLPPSESKTPHDSGSALDLGTLSFPGLTDARAHMCTRLRDLSLEDRAWEKLGVSERLAPEVARNTELFTAPAGPAIDTYTGVLFSALDAESVRHPERLASVFISSALFGVVNARDHIPAYRLSMTTKALAPAAWWKEHLAPVLNDVWDAEVVLDCRSGAYRRPWPGFADRTLTVNVVTEVDGVCKTVSHNAKHARGLVVRHLLNRDRELPTTVESVVTAVSEAFTVEHDGGSLTVVV